MPVFLGLETHHGLHRMTPAHQKRSPPKAARAQYSARWHGVIVMQRPSRWSMIRSSTMAGLGYDLFDHKSHLLTFGAGPAAVYQNFTTEPDTLSPSAMWLVRWYREFRGGDLRLFHHHQGFQDVGASRAFRLNADQGIRVKIFGDFSLNLEYDLRFNTEPAPGRKELDQAFIFGVAYEIER